MTERARAFVAGNLEAAADLGRRLAIEVADPDSFVDVLRAGLAALVDPEYRDGIQRVAPGLGPVLGVRQPLLAAVWRSFRGHTRR
ncbi:MAG TPA: hypothetical protein VIV06_07840, partial [Candidatus Limnocylindrales bacterium]